MRRLLLLLLTLLIPLQLLAATAEPQLRQGGQGSQAQLCEAAATLGQWHAHALAGVYQTDVAGEDTSDEDDDFPSLQAELEDPTLPASIATPGVHWYPFPHVFSTVLTWSSYLRDQLRPPPLA
ncbi:hypothetical protein G5B88_09900 [Herbaspirillum seropedicae]|uniref:hypothetical protein n=1 Tax=Herbaspirillum seropedicae TaxID=964 RepID=UPI00031EB976|nr:hypothetical protein [Herbaspirillum seropedicae]AKN65501.1 hypothetical protein ACP92_09795 [Herbaspirillum seropedicae]NQE28659.1 hypothetical protein [Herbaspirillum seropedicae]UMU21468.1 hypothetical protein G5B88_09900 [Herbaspirillum seropedicae]